MAYLENAARLGEQHGLALHLDGARVFNAAVKQKVPPETITRHFDSVSACLSKGLGAPLGAVLCGTKSFIADARKWRKMVGGGMRQAGVIAAAGIIALEDMVERLAEDHANARRLANGLSRIPGISIDPEGLPTNLVFFNVDRGDPANIMREMNKLGVKGGSPSRRWRSRLRQGPSGLTFAG